MTPEVGLVLESPPGDGSFVDHAVRARTDLGGDADRVALAVGDATGWDPAWRGALAHGAGLREWAKRRAGEGRRVVLTDWPDGEPVAGLCVVDWAWWQAAYAIGFAAGAGGNPSLAIVAGPAVATQRRIVRAAFRGYADGGGRGTMIAYHLESFADLAGARRAAAELGPGDGGMLLSSAGAASAQLADDARAAGWQVAGFGGASGVWRFRVASDVSSGARDLLERLLADDELPARITFGSGSGLLRVEVDPSLGAAVETLVAEALERATAPDVAREVTAD